MRVSYYAVYRGRKSADLLPQIHYEDKKSSLSENANPNTRARVSRCNATACGRQSESQGATRVTTPCKGALLLPAVNFPYLGKDANCRAAYFRATSAGAPNGTARGVSERSARLSLLGLEKTRTTGRLTSLLIRNNNKKPEVSMIIFWGSTKFQLTVSAAKPSVGGDTKQLNK